MNALKMLIAIHVFVKLVTMVIDARKVSCLNFFGITRPNLVPINYTNYKVWISNDKERKDLGKCLSKR